MSKTVKVPDAVYDRLKAEKAERNVSMGAVIEGWMQDSDTLDEITENFEEHFQ